MLVLSLMVPFILWALMQFLFPLLEGLVMEQWSVDFYPPVEAPAPVKRAGINLGAPGNRFGDDGTLWMEFPSVGGPSPDLPIRVVGDNVEGPLLMPAASA